MAACDSVACEVWSVIKFLNAQSIAPIEIHCQLCQVYGPNIMSKADSTLAGVGSFPKVVKVFMMKNAVGDRPLSMMSLCGSA